MICRNRGESPAMASPGPAVTDGELWSSVSPVENLMRLQVSTGIVCVALVSSLGSAIAADKPVKKIAPTVAEALKVFDPETLPLLPTKDDEKVGRIHVGGFTYTTTKDVKSAFEFYQAEFEKRKWKELPNTYVSDDSCSATLAKDGYHLSLSTSKIGDGTMVIIHNHGKLDLKKLPLPQGVKPLHSFPITEAFLSDAKREDVAAELTKLLVAQGWEPYGTAGNQMFFKQNALRLSADVMTAPALGNKTAITFSTEQLSADIPATAETVQLQYSDSTKHLFFDYAADDIEAGFAAIYQFYNDKLAADGWKPTTDKPIEDGNHSFFIYRNPAKDLIEVNMTEFEGQVRVGVDFQTAKEVAEIDAQIKAELAKRKKEKEKPTATTPDEPELETLKIALPADAKNVETDKSEIKFHVGNGKAKPFAAALAKKLKAGGWKELSVTLEDMAGAIVLEKDDRDLTIIYLETGVLPSEVKLMGRGLEVEKVKAK